MKYSPHTKETAQRILELAKKEGASFAEITVVQNTFSLKRIRKNQVDQPPAGEEWTLDLGLVKGKRRKNVSFDSPMVAEKLIKETLNQIEFLPEHQPFIPTEPFPPVEQPPALYDEKTAELSDENLIPIAKEIAVALAPHNLFLSGKILQSRGEASYANTVGTVQTAKFTQAAAGLFAFDANDLFTSAYASSGGISIDHIDKDRMVQELLQKCRLQQGKEKKDIFAGKEDGEEVRMDVILEPYFFSAIFEWLGFFGFNGLFVERGESFISNKIGQQVMGQNITITDDPADSKNNGMGFPFDFEGRPRTKVTLVEKGIAKGGVYDSALAAEWKKQATCNALPPSARTEGAAPFDLVIEGGTTPVAEMIKQSKEPTLWITKLHYPGMKHYQTGTMTGIAQHGVFLIENGKVVSPVENVRFEESMPEALKRVEALSESRVIFDPLSISLPSCVVAPAMKIKQFRFIGSTKRTT
jgi:PmbA protein